MNVVQQAQWLCQRGFKSGKVQSVELYGEIFAHRQALRISKSC